MRTIFHIDVNSAFLSWSAAERVKNGIYPDLRSIPAVVAGSKNNRKGIVLASSIPAKKFGIKTGEELYKAFEKCKNLTVIPPDYKLYQRYSKKMIEICNKFSPIVEVYSIDELFLDYTNMDIHFGDPLIGAEKIQMALLNELGITVNIGISTNKLLAKTASDFEKPNKIHTLYPEEIEGKLWNLPVSNLLMIGRQTTKKLNLLGIKTIGQLANTDEDLLKFHFHSQGKLIKAYANGIDLSCVRENPEEIKSISNGTTMPKDADTPNEAYSTILSLCEKISFRMREKEFSCSHISISTKTQNFQIKSYSQQLNSPIFTTNDLYAKATAMLNKMWDNTPIRAITVEVSRFSDMNFYQYNFFDNSKNHRKEILDKKIDSIRKIYGYSSITRATLINNPLAQSIANNTLPKLSAKL